MKALLQIYTLSWSVPVQILVIRARPILPFYCGETEPPLGINLRKVPVNPRLLEGSRPRVRALLSPGRRVYSTFTKSVRVLSMPSCSNTDPFSSASVNSVLVKPFRPPSFCQQQLTDEQLMCRIEIGHV